MRTIIIDDTKINRQALVKLIGVNLPQLRVVGEANSLESGVKEMLEKKPDLLILDIELGDGNGFQLLEQLHEIDFHVIFVTAYDHYAIKAFKVNAIDYLLKPINVEELISAVSKINVSATKPNILDSLKNIKNSDVLSVSTQRGFETLEISNLIRCEADGKYTHCIRKEGKNFLSSKNLKAFEILLTDKHFVRVHHSHLINLNHIKSFNRYDSVVTMINGEEIPISQRKKSDFIKRVNLI